MVYGPSRMVHLVLKDGLMEPHPFAGIQGSRRPRGCTRNPGWHLAFSGTLRYHMLLELEFQNGVHDSMMDFGTNFLNYLIIRYLPTAPNYPLRHPKYHLIETMRPLIEAYWGV